MIPWKIRFDHEEKRDEEGYLILDNDRVAVGVYDSLGNLLENNIEYTVINTEIEIETWDNDMADLENKVKLNG